MGGHLQTIKVGDLVRFVGSAPASREKPRIGVVLEVHKEKFKRTRLTVHFANSDLYRSKMIADATKYQLISGGK
jgi:hypothetical protein